MCGAYGLCVFLIVFVAGTSNCIIVQQISSLLANETNSITITCSHDDSSKTVMLWYQQKTDTTAMALIGYTTTRMSDPVYEDGFTKERIKLNRQGDTEGDLTISRLLQSDSAVYYCAAKEHSAACSYDYCTKTPNTKHTGNSTNCCFMLNFWFVI
ncbi:hypothetical protein SRHO_G00137720 [Serrasalmus rhombeus]